MQLYRDAGKRVPLGSTTIVGASDEGLQARRAAAVGRAAVALLPDETG
jgi:hypothetical protein